MFKRMVLGFTFLAALGAAGLGVSSKAAAWDDCYGSYRTSYYPTYTAYPAYYGYAPSVAYYRAPVVVRGFDFHSRDYGHHHHHDYDRNHISFSFGF